MTDKEKLEKIKALADKMYSRMAYLTSDTRPIRQAMDEYHQFIINEYYKEEPKFKTGDRIKPIDSCLGSPRTIVDVCDSWYETDQGTLDFEYEDNWELVEESVSEGLEEAAVEICSKVLKGETIIIDGYEYVVLSDAEECFKAGAQWQKVQDYFKIIYPKIITEGTIEQYAQKVAYDMSNDWAIDNPTWDDVQNACKLGANWQETKDESTTEDLGEYINELSKQFPEVSFAKLSRIAVRVAKWQMAQMMANAINVEVKVDAGGYPYIPQMELYDYDKDIPLAKKEDKYKVILIKED